MALNIISARQTILVTSIIAYLYADPGIGKTSLAFTASRPVLFDFDQGAHRAGKMRRGGTVTVAEWADVTEITAEDLADYDTLIIDTAGRMLECIKAYLAKNPNNRQGDGSLKLKAHGAAGEIFRTWLSRIKSYGKDIVLIAHAAEAPKGDNIIIRPDIGGKNQGELYKQADLMGYMTNIEGKGNTVRVIDFVPNVAYLAKNSGNLGCVTVPDLETEPTFLADLLQKSKDFINSMTDAQVKELSDVDDLTNWENDCELCEDAEDLNQLLTRLDKDHSRYVQMRTAFKAAAAALDVSFDRADSIYIDNKFVDSEKTESTKAQQETTSVIAAHQKPDDATRKKINDLLFEAMYPEDFENIEMLIADMPAPWRDEFYDAVEETRKALEGKTQKVVTPANPAPEKSQSESPLSLFTEEEIASKIDSTTNVDELDALVRQIENHKNDRERSRLLKHANLHRREINNGAAA